MLTVRVEPRGSVDQPNSVFVLIEENNGQIFDATGIPNSDRDFSTPEEAMMAGIQLAEHLNRVSFPPDKKFEIIEPTFPLGDHSDEWSEPHSDWMSAENVIRSSRDLEISRASRRQKNLDRDFPALFAAFKAQKGRIPREECRILFDVVDDFVSPAVTGEANDRWSAFMCRIGYSAEDAHKFLVALDSVHTLS